MDYKYIEQLIESYFDCRTTLQEEQILRSFFEQEEVPAHLAQYADLFNYETMAQSETLGEDFDKRLLAKLEAKPQRASRRAHIVKMAAPFFKAAAVVAMALTIGRAAEHAIGEQAAEEKNPVMAVDPYIKTSDVQQAIRVKDMQQAEAKAVSDSIIAIQTQDGIQ